MTTAAGERMLQTKGADVEAFEADWRLRLLAVITDPNVAPLLMMIGVWGLFFEFFNPGFVMPGVAGASALRLPNIGLRNRRTVTRDPERPDDLFMGNGG